MCGFLGASFLYPLSQCRTSVDRCFLHSTDTIRENETAFGVIMTKRCPFLALRTHQVGKATDRKTAGSSNKLQQAHPLLVVHLLHKLSKGSVLNTNQLT